MERQTDGHMAKLTNQQTDGQMEGYAERYTYEEQASQWTQREREKTEDQTDIWTYGQIDRVQTEQWQTERDRKWKDRQTYEQTG